MTQDVRQWLAEIKSLQHKLTQICQERDEAYAGAANWRKLYEKEAQQRRTDTHLAKQTIEALNQEIQELRHLPYQTDALPATESEVIYQIDQLNVSELKQQLVAALLDRDRLLQALKAEQQEHSKTRNGLTTALGDTVDRLNRERANRKGSPETNGNSTLPHPDSTKTPSLELPPLDQAQSLV